MGNIDRQSWHVFLVLVGFGLFLLLAGSGLGLAIGLATGWGAHT